MWSSKNDDAQDIAFVRWKTKNILRDMKKPKFQNNVVQRMQTIEEAYPLNEPALRDMVTSLNE